MRKGKKLTEMLLLATQAHDGQYDLRGQPYILHPLAVMHKLDTEDEELMCIALGHDLLEDCTITLQELHDQFGPRIALGIAALTRAKDEPYETDKSNVLNNVDAMRVKVCDLAHNMEPGRLRHASAADAKRLRRYIQFYHELAELLRLETLP